MLKKKRKLCWFLFLSSKALFCLLLSLCHYNSYVLSPCLLYRATQTNKRRYLKFNNTIMAFTVKCHKSVITKTNTFIPNTWSQGTRSDVLRMPRKKFALTVPSLNYSSSETKAGNRGTNLKQGRLGFKFTYSVCDGTTFLTLLNCRIIFLFFFSKYSHWCFVLLHKNICIL